MDIKIIKYRILSLLLILPFFIAYWYHTTFLEERTQKIEQKMYDELTEIKVLKNSELIDTYKAHKSDNALVYTEYYTILTKDSIIGHYNKELKENGWEHCCNDDDPGYFEYIFKKEEFYMHLYIKTIRVNNRQKFRLSVTWGLFGCSQCKE